MKNHSNTVTKPDTKQELVNAIHDFCKNIVTIEYCNKKIDDSI